MKKLIGIFISLLTLGGLFQACDNSKTYSEMLDDERSAITKFVKEQGIRTISLGEFEVDTVTMCKDRGDAYDEYVAFSNGVFLQIVDRGEDGELNKFVNNDNINARYVEKNIMTGDTTCFNVFLPAYADNVQLYKYPAVFRYYADASVPFGQFTQMDTYWGSKYGTRGVPAGWIISLPYLKNKAHIRLIVPSKMGHNSASQYVTPFFYDIRELKK